MPTVSHKCCCNYFKSSNNIPGKSDRTLLCPSPFYRKQQHNSGLGDFLFCFVFLFCSLIKMSAIVKLLLCSSRSHLLAGIRKDSFDLENTDLHGRLIDWGSIQKASLWTKILIHIYHHRKIIKGYFTFKSSTMSLIAYRLLPSGVPFSQVKIMRKCNLCKYEV